MNKLSSLRPHGATNCATWSRCSRHDEMRLAGAMARSGRDERCAHQRLGARCAHQRRRRSGSRFCPQPSHVRGRRRGGHDRCDARPSRVEQGDDQRRRESTSPRSGSKCSESRWSSGAMGPGAMAGIPQATTGTSGASQTLAGASGRVFQFAPFPSLTVLSPLPLAVFIPPKECFHPFHVLNKQMVVKVTDCSIRPPYSPTRVVSSERSQVCGRFTGLATVFNSQYHARISK